MKILHLTLTAKWFEMIASGVKTEEYREIKPHWNKRILNKNYDAIQFVNGYGNHRPKMLVELKQIVYGIGNPAWGGGNEKVFILMFGNILKLENYEAKP